MPCASYFVTRSPTVSPVPSRAVLKHLRQLGDADGVRRAQVGDRAGPLRMVKTRERSSPASTKLPWRAGLSTVPI